MLPAKGTRRLQRRSESVLAGMRAVKTNGISGHVGINVELINEGSSETFNVLKSEVCYEINILRCSRNSVH